MNADPDELVNLWGSKAHVAVKADLIERLAELEIAVSYRVPLPTAQA